MARSVRSINLIDDQSQPLKGSIAQGSPLEAAKEGIRLRLNRARMTKLLFTVEEDLLRRIRRGGMNIGALDFGLERLMSLKGNVLACYGKQCFRNRLW